ncbi:MAG TPA: exodeoxyribonuclease VII large subunit, partial [Chromatiales bacterium]|nr:exodeoxyribonuclease VII large subunit [Chromatiales bacterium]HEX22406.1 exodeoxyribonuclease VII large subunit [Chromatiales bacterium]
RCAMFKMRRRLLGFQPENGNAVLARVRVSLYEARGDYQLIVEHLEEAGDGRLRRQFEQLKLRLAAEGLFDTARKRPLPGLPRCIGVITSPSGAAIRDVLSVLQRRFPAIPVLIYPVPVQGSEAPPAIVDALHTAAQRNECDLLLLTRGGGSLEDLWAFNDEAVARAIVDSPIPVVSAVGHEIDTTIADFVADVRAPTPSAAAELISPDRGEWLDTLRQWRSRLIRAIQSRLAREQQHLRAVSRHLKHPGQRLQDQAQRLDELEQRLSRALRARLRHNEARLGALTVRLHGQSPARQLQALQLRLAASRQRLRAAMPQRLEQDRQRLGALTRALDTVSPLATLSRGYAIVQRTDGQVIRKAGEVEVGKSVQVRLGEGRLDCRVEDIHED